MQRSPKAWFSPKTTIKTRWENQQFSAWPPKFDCFLPFCVCWSETVIWAERNPIPQKIKKKKNNYFPNGPNERNQKLKQQLYISYRFHVLYILKCFWLMCILLCLCAYMRNKQNNYCRKSLTYSLCFVFDMNSYCWNAIGMCGALFTSIVCARYRRTKWFE